MALWQGKVRGHSIVPLYSSVPEAALKDVKLYELLDLVDALRVERAREIAIKELKLRLDLENRAKLLKASFLKSKKK